MLTGCNHRRSGGIVIGLQRVDILSIPDRIVCDPFPSVHRRHAATFRAARFRGVRVHVRWRQDLARGA